MRHNHTFLLTTSSRTYRIPGCHPPALVHGEVLGGLLLALQLGFKLRHLCGMVIRPALGKQELGLDARPRVLLQVPQREAARPRDVSEDARERRCIEALSGGGV